jgi:ribosomal protein S25
MVDDEIKQCGPDRIKVARYQGYKPYYLARKYGITLKLARILIKRTGRDRVKLNKAAKGLARKRTKAAEA